ncbi:MAG: hypothetical protein MI861_21160 [Pirellulales bacterium]|nr:hypothetical protein [Pirellulales bacterium]
MLSNDKEQVTDFLQWAEHSYSQEVALKCKELVEKLGPDKEFEPEDLVWEAYSICNKFACETSDAMGDSIFDSELELE